MMLEADNYQQGEVVLNKDFSNVIPTIKKPLVRCYSTQFNELTSLSITYGRRALQNLVSLLNIVTILRVLPF